MQGYNKYYPPDYDGKKSLNQLAGKGHGLGNRANKIKQGILTVRFEAPYDIICLGCQRNIAQGVRFNAEKKKVGSYYTSPIWAFGMKCASCSNWIEIRTDPKNTTYEVTKGAKRRLAEESTSESPSDVKRVLGDDVFADVEEYRTAKTVEQVRDQEIKELYQANMRQWQDPFTQSQKLRNQFRIQKKAAQVKEQARKHLSNKHSLHVRLVDESDSDVKTAKSISYGTSLEDDAKSVLEKRLHSSAFSKASIETSRNHKQNALTNIATLVDKQFDSFAVVPTTKRKKSAKAVTLKPSQGLVQYSSDEE